MKDFERILIISPHTDDSELGCGGTIAKFIEEKKEIHLLVLSPCYGNVPPGFPKDALIKEVKEATSVLGIKQKNLYIEKFKVRKFSYSRQEILDTLINYKKQIEPELVFIPSLQDTHQDHQTTAQECFRAFKDVSIFAYELPWNQIVFNTQAFIALENHHIEKKIQALNCYKTQKNKPYFSPDFIKGLALTRGAQIKRKFAEGFEIIRLIF